VATEALAIPALQVAGRLPSNDALIKLDVALLPPDHAGIRTYANVCSRMLTYAHVWCEWGRVAGVPQRRMLTYGVSGAGWLEFHNGVC
jgi:hypothetical protein